MNLEQRLRDHLVARAPDGGFTARVMAQVGKAPVIDIHARARKRGRFIVLGTLLVMGVAAAMLALQLSAVHTQQAVQLNTPQSGTGQPSGMAEPPVADDGIADAGSPPSAGKDVASKSVVAQVAPPPPDVPRSYAVLAMPAVDSSGEAGAKQPAEAFRAALIADLARMPDVMVVEWGNSAGGNPKIDYQLTITSLKWKRYPSGAVEISSTDGGTSSQSGGDQPSLPGLGTEYWAVEASIQDLQHPEPLFPQGRSYSSRLFIVNNGSPRGDMGCGSGGSISRVMTDPRSLFKPCGNTAQVAAGLVEVMREQSQGPATAQQQALSGLRASPPTSGMQSLALNGLISTARREGERLDPAITNAIVEAISALPPERRAQQWLSLRTSKEAVLVQPQIDALLHDTDEEVRLTVLTNLMASSTGDERVQAAIRAAATSDSRQIVRMNARRALYGDEEWNNHVAATVLDASLPLGERLQPLVVSAQSATNQAAFDTLQRTLMDEKVSGLIIKAIRDRKPDTSQGETILRVLNLLQNVDRPEVVELLLEIVQAQDAPESDRQLVGRAFNMLRGRQSDPRVRQALEAIAAGKGNPSLRFQAEQELSRNPR